MNSFPRWRRRSAGLALLPVAAALTFAATDDAADAAPQAPKLNVSKSQVGPGSKVTVRARFPQATAESTRAAGAKSLGEPVTLQFRPAGTSYWRSESKTRAGRDGRYAERVAVKRSGRFRAVSASGKTTRPTLVRVKSRVSARVADDSPTTGERVTVKGTVRPGGAGRKVTVRIDGDILSTRTNKRGRFDVRWKASSTGEYRVRVKAASNKAAERSSTRAGKVTVFREALASWYGPGFYGRRTACGQTLTTSTLGVANKSLPCGTKLTLSYKGKQVRVEVIDRGPYVGTREFDLTSATRQKLGFGSTGTVLSSR